MIIGTGIDIVEISRIKRAAQKWGDTFLNKVFTRKELEYSKKKHFPYQHLAARFAAKEAVAKAFGDVDQISWKDIEVNNLENGKPHIKLTGNANSLKNKRGINKIIISLSHSKNYAVANAILVNKESQ